MANVKGKQRIISRMYTPGKTSQWEAEAVKSICLSGVGKPMLYGALRIDIVAVFERPQRMMTKRWPNKREYHTSKPDKDNVEKIVMDALQKAGVIRDDCIVCTGETSKWYADRVETPHIAITITWLGEIAA